MTTLLPNSQDIEQSVLCSCLSDVKSLNIAAEMIASDNYFYNDNHRKIWVSIKALYVANSPVDVLVVIEWLRSNGDIDDVLTDVFVCNILGVATSNSNIARHIDILRDKYVARETMVGCQNAIDNLALQQERPENILSALDQRIISLSDNTSKTKLEHVKTMAGGVIAEVEAYHRKKGVSGITTGIYQLDEMTTGFHSGELIILAARPGIGKTSFALGMALSAAKSGKRCAIFSMEMPRNQIMIRMICSESGTDIKRVRQGALLTKELASFGVSTNAIAEMDIYIDDSSVLTPTELRAKCKRLAIQTQLDFVVVDYLQLMRGDRKAESVQQEVADISRALKCLSKDLGVPIVALSQLNRQIENRTTDKKPQLSDLRSSGAIEQDADTVIFIHAPNKSKEESSEKNIYELVIGKQRNGPTGSVKVLFQDFCAKFCNLDTEHANTPAPKAKTVFRGTGVERDDVF